MPLIFPSMAHGPVPMAEPTTRHNFSTLGLYLGAFAEARYSPIFSAEAAACSSVIRLKPITCVSSSPMGSTISLLIVVLK